MAIYTNDAMHAASMANASKSAAPTYTNDTPSMTTSKLLMETSDFLLLETGDKILLESLPVAPTWSNASKSS